MRQSMQYAWTEMDYSHVFNDLVSKALTNAMKNSFLIVILSRLMADTKPHSLKFTQRIPIWD